MRDQLHNDIMTSLSTILDQRMLQAAGVEIDKVLNNYDISKRCTALAVYDNIPPCYKIYFATRKIEGLSDNTLKCYKGHLDRFFRMVHRPFEQLTTSDIRVFLYEYQQQSGCSDRTLDEVRTCVAVFFKWAQAEGYLEKNPCANVKPIKHQNKPRGYLNEMELEQMRMACTTPRDKLLVELFYSTACRVSEVVGLKLSDLDLYKGEARVLGKGNKYRTVYLTPKVLILLKEYLSVRKGESEYVITSNRSPYNGLGRRQIENLISELGKRAGIERSVYPHLIRHTTSTHAIQRGMDVTEIQRMLGHSKIDTTLIYADVADSSVKASHKKYIT